MEKATRAGMLAPFSGGVRGMHPGSCGGFTSREGEQIPLGYPFAFMIRRKY